MKKQLMTAAVAALLGLGFTGCQNASEKYLQTQLEKGVTLDSQLIKIASNTKNVWEVDKNINNKDMLEAIVDKNMVDFSDEKLSKRILETLLYKDNYSMIKPFMDSGMKTDIVINGRTALEDSLVKGEISDVVALLNIGMTLKASSESAKYLTTHERLKEFGKQHSSTHTILFVAKPTMFKNKRAVQNQKRENRKVIFTKLQKEGIVDFTSLFAKSDNKTVQFNTNQMALILMNQVDKSKRTPEFSNAYYNLIAKQTIESTKNIPDFKMSKASIDLMKKYVSNNKDKSINADYISIFQKFDEYDPNFIKNMISSN